MANQFEPKSKDVIDWLSERTNRQHVTTDELKKKSLVGVWIDPDQMTLPYQFQNGYAQSAPPETLFRYRFFNVDTLQVIGTLVGGTSGAIAFRLLPPFIQLLTGNIHFFGNVLDTPTVVIARFDVDYTDGDVTVTYP